MRRLTSATLACMLALVAPLHAVMGQTVGAPPLAEPNSRSLAVLGVNVVTSALGAGLMARLTGGSFWRAAAAGAGGGALGYAGKRLAVQEFEGAGLLGRQVASVGASVVQNGIAGRGIVDRVVLPLWIGRLYIERDAQGDGLFRVQPRLDLLAAVLTTAAVIDPDRRFNFSRTLAAGAPVFVMRSDVAKWRGAQLSGVIWLEDQFGPDALRTTLAHELVHVLQHDGAFLSWTEAGEQHVLSLLPGVRRAGPWIDVGVHTGIRGALSGMIRYDDRPWEWEARNLSGTARSHHD